MSLLTQQRALAVALLAVGVSVFYHTWHWLEPGPPPFQHSCYRLSTWNATDFEAWAQARSPAEAFAAEFTRLATTTRSAYALMCDLSHAHLSRLSRVENDDDIASFRMDLLKARIRWCCEYHKDWDLDEWVRSERCHIGRIFLALVSGVLVWFWLWVVTDMHLWPTTSWSWLS